jgi:DNA-directed RNA polymerase subunit RPC12/RpoP
MQKLTEISPGASFEICTQIWQACGYQNTFIGWGRDRRGACEPAQHVSIRVENYWDAFIGDGAEVAGEWNFYKDAPKTFRGCIDSCIDQWNEHVRKKLGLPVAFDKGKCLCLRCSHTWESQDKNDPPKRCAKCRSPLWNKPRQRKQSEKQGTSVVSHLAAT